MFTVINKQVLDNQVKRLDILAPEIARRILPGQFVGVCPEEGDERIPLTVIEADADKKTISLIFQEAGETTIKLGKLSIQEKIFSILGPLGVPARIEKKGVVVCIATGVGMAQILPISRALRKVGNNVIGIFGAKTRRAILLESQMRLSCNKFFIATNDGSFERRGLATDVLKDVINKQRDISLVYAIGSVDMMEAVCAITKEKGIETRVQLNPFMVDCMGMCGSCRVKVGNQVVLACVDGPEFDGHKVDFKDLQIRVNAFQEQNPWGNTKLLSSPRTSEPKTLTKFLSGILRK